MFGNSTIDDTRERFTIQPLSLFLNAWIVERGEKVIRRDVRVQKYGLNDQQSKAIEFLLAYGKLTIKEFEQLCPDVNRRSLQRDLKDFLKKRLTKESGTGTTDPTRHYVLSEL